MKRIYTQINMPRKSKVVAEVKEDERECYSTFEVNDVPVKPQGKEWIMAIDPGKVNFAFLIEEIDTTTVAKLKCPTKSTRFVRVQADTNDEIDSDETKPKKKRKTTGKKRGSDMEPTAEYTSFLDEFVHCGRTILCANHNLDVAETKKMRGSRCLNPGVYMKLTTLLDSYRPYLDQCSTIVIEQQMSYGSKINTMAIKIAQHTYSYFLFRYGQSKQIVEFPSYNKTQILGAPAGLEKPQRKKWAIVKADEIWTMRGDMDASEYVGSKRKKDDMSDCLLHVLSYVITDRFG